MTALRTVVDQRDSLSSSNLSESVPRDEVMIHDQSDRYSRSPVAVAAVDTAAALTAAVNTSSGDAHVSSRQPSTAPPSPPPPSDGIHLDHADVDRASQHPRQRRPYPCTVAAAYPLERNSLTHASTAQEEIRPRSSGPHLGHSAALDLTVTGFAHSDRQP